MGLATTLLVAKHLDSLLHLRNSQVKQVHGDEQYDDHKRIKPTDYHRLDTVIFSGLDTYAIIYSREKIWLR